MGSFFPSDRRPDIILQFAPKTRYQSCDETADCGVRPQLFLLMFTGILVELRLQIPKHVSPHTTPDNNTHVDARPRLSTASLTEQQAHTAVLLLHGSFLTVCLTKLEGRNSLHTSVHIWRSSKQRFRSRGTVNCGNVNCFSL